VLVAARSERRWQEWMDSFFRERWWAHQAIVSVGAGILASSLLMAAAVTTWRFRLRTLLLVTLYLALLLGIPCGVVRPHLYNPHISLHFGPSISQVWVHYSQSSNRPGGGPNWGFVLVNRKNVSVAVGSFVL